VISIATKELLKQYCDLQKEIKELEQRIERVRNKNVQVVTDSVKGSSKHFPYIERSFVITGLEEDKREQQLEKLNSILYKRRAKCTEFKLEIEEFINTIPDSRTRRVFTLRYIDGLNWLQIARKIERYDESYPRKVIHDKYLEKI
jgi:DNA-directed RNA polymerase specialized sigma24 family protein